MRGRFLVSLLLVLMLASLVIVSASPGSSQLFDCVPQTDIVTGISVTDPPYAYDGDLDTFAWFQFSAKAGSFELKDFTSPATVSGNLPSITQVDFKMRYNTTANTSTKLDDMYRIVYIVDPSPTVTVLVAWTNGATATPLATYTWASQPEPNDATWDWTDVGSIRFVVECSHSGGTDAGCGFWEHEVWVTVITPDAKLRVNPTSIIDLTKTPETAKTIRPDGDGTYTAWDGTYVDWDETTQNGDADYVNASASYKWESSTLENPSHPTWTIARVRVVIVARYNETSDERLIPILVVGGSYYSYPPYNPPWGSLGYALTTSYQTYTADWGRNPATDSYWTWSDIDALEAGVLSYGVGAWTGEIRITQLYVEVDGPRFTVDVLAEDVLNLWGYEFKLLYDKNLLTGTASIPNVDPNFGFSDVSFDEIHDDQGWIWVSASLPPPIPAEGTSGNLTLVTIDFLVEGTGESNLDIDETYAFLESPIGPISMTVVDGFFKNGAAVPEFPLGMAVELALTVAIVYVWWKHRRKTKTSKQGPLPVLSTL